MSNYKNLLIRIPVEVWKDLDSRKKVLGISYTWQILAALRTYFNKDVPDLTPKP